MDDLKNKPEAYWKGKLTPEQYRVLREHGTEPAFTGSLLQNKENGMYTCGACGQELFSSDAKFESGSGWPSFYAAVDEKKIELIRDESYGMQRTEVRCARCGSHLGHVFDDGPQSLPDGTPATGKRYCINSCALDFKSETDAS